MGTSAAYMLRVQERCEVLHGQLVVVGKVVHCDSTALRFPESNPTTREKLHVAAFSQDPTAHTLARCRSTREALEGTERHTNDCEVQLFCKLYFGFRTCVIGKLMNDFFNITIASWYVILKSTSSTSSST